MSSRIRDSLNETCSYCGVTKAEAESIHPVSHGRYSLGPGWLCGSCLHE